MQRLTMHLAVALLTFAIGLLTWWLAFPLRMVILSPHSEPLRVTLSSSTNPADSDIPFNYKVVTVEKVSSKTVHGIFARLDL